MGGWNYRLTVQTVDDGELWAVREMYYDDEGRVQGWSRAPDAPTGESIGEFSATVDRYAGVLRYPVFDLDTKSWCTGPGRRPLGDIPFGDQEKSQPGLGFLP